MGLTALVYIITLLLCIRTEELGTSGARSSAQHDAESLLGSGMMAQEYWLRNDGLGVAGVGSLGEVAIPRNSNPALRENSNGKLAIRLAGRICACAFDRGFAGVVAGFVTG